MCMKKKNKTLIDITQSMKKASQGNQIGIQNNYSGLSIEQTVAVASALIESKLPGLREEARNVAKERAEELFQAMNMKMNKEGLDDYSAFKEPDVQYIFEEAHRQYARFGTEDRLNILSSLLCQRLQYDKDFVLKVAIDKAIEIASLVTPEQLDLLSLMFLCDIAIDNTIVTIDDFVDRYTEIAQTYKNADFSSIPYLHLLGCLFLDTPSIAYRYSQIISVSEEEIENACPEIIKKTIGDYSPSYVGTVLAIMNIEIKTGQKLDPHDWIQ